MLQTIEERQQREYTIRNRDASPRTVVIEHPVRPGWMLADGEEPAESAASYHHYRITVEPKKTAELLVKEFHPLVNRYELVNTGGRPDHLFSEPSEH
jgi:hypothetical protein